MKKDITVAVVLGYQLNLDSTMDKLLVQRLDLFLRLYKEQHIDYVIVSGGRPREEVIKSEAEVMCEYLVNQGINRDIIYLEDRSGSTRGNALFSVPIAKELGATRIIVVSTIEHFIRYNFNPINLFSEQIKDDNISLMIYTNNIPIF